MKLRVLLAALLLAISASSVFAQEATREDFRDFCRAFTGRWVGDVTWVADWPGFGKKGDKVTAYSEITVTEDGKALITKFYGGNGSGTGLVAFDAGARQIRWLWVSSGGHVSHSILYKKGAQWVEKGAGSNPDGTKTEYVSMVTVSDNGNTHTWTGSGTLGGKKVDDQHDVWRRVSK